ncbi:MAG: orotidine 5'-phosphate decarboxylase [Candidatus Bathyarchaeota archaeon]|nr:orotidine 5'-phosphate decarboxylase [Candidatus Bathyarchaeota archaeon]
MLEASELNFKDKMAENAKAKGSNIVLALDFPYEKPENRGILYRRAERVLEAVHPHVCAVKINHHLVLPLGIFPGVKNLVDLAHDRGLLAIMDCKVNDVGSTNQVIADYYFASGFDALIANPFVGWDEGLQPIFETARKLGRGVILLVYMSHKGAEEGYGQTVIDHEFGGQIPQYLLFARKALKWNADGVVVGATYPERIREVSNVLNGRVPIYSPGVGVQGGDIKSALESGATYLIVGRAITLSDNPAESAERIKRAVNAMVKL